jgi:deoxyribose-phosphate aldolase
MSEGGSAGLRHLASRCLPLIDLTDLGDRSTAADVEHLCERAVGRHGSVAAVCIWPRSVARAVTALAGTGVGVATVVNFPSGDEPVDVVVAATSRALEDGADDIDVVIPYRALVAGRAGDAGALLAAVRAAVPTGTGRVLKVILETGELPGDDAVRRAADLAVDHGADFLKTSTGKTAVSATLGATATMLAVIRERSAAVGLKPSGGIRTVVDAGRYLAQADEVMGPAWVARQTFRFGASSLLDDVERVLDAEVAGERGGA